MKPVDEAEAQARLGEMRLEVENHAIVIRRRGKDVATTVGAQL